MSMASSVAGEVEAQYADANGMSWAYEQYDYRALVGEEHVMDISEDDESYVTDSEATADSDVNMSTDGEDSDDEIEPKHADVDAKANAHDIFRSCNSLPLDMQAQIRSALHNIARHWYIFSAAEALPVAAIQDDPDYNENSENWWSPMMTALEQISGETISDTGMREALELIHAAGFLRLSRRSTTRGRGPSHAIWKDVAFALEKLKKGTKEPCLAGKRKRGPAEDGDGASKPAKKRSSPKAKLIPVESIVETNSRRGRRRAPKPSIKSSASRNKSSRRAEDEPEPPNEDLSNALSSLSVTHSDISALEFPSPPSTESIASEAPPTPSSSSSSGSSSSTGSSSAPSSQQGTNASTKKKGSRRRRSFGSRAFRPTISPYPLYSERSSGSHEATPEVDDDVDQIMHGEGEDNGDDIGVSGQTNSRASSQTSFRVPSSTDSSPSPRSQGMDDDALSPIVEESNDGIGGSDQHSSRSSSQSSFRAPSLTESSPSPRFQGLNDNPVSPIMEDNDDDIGGHDQNNNRRSSQTSFRVPSSTESSPSPRSQYMNDDASLPIVEDEYDGIEVPNQNHASLGSQDIVQVPFSLKHPFPPRSQGMNALSPVMEVMQLNLTPVRLPKPAEPPAAPARPKTPPSFMQRLRNFGARFSPGSPRSPLQGKSEMKRPSMRVEKPQRKQIRGTMITASAGRPAQGTGAGRPRAYSDVRKIKLRQGERVVLVPADEN